MYILLICFLFLLKQKLISTLDIHIEFKDGDDKDVSDPIIPDQTQTQPEAKGVQDVEARAKGAVIAFDQIEAQVQPPEIEDVV